MRCGSGLLNDIATLIPRDSRAESRRTTASTPEDRLLPCPPRRTSLVAGLRALVVEWSIQAGVRARLVRTRFLGG